MRGPKPCPFAIFDAKGVTQTFDPLYPNQSIPTYSATNNSAWNGLNADGIQLPNVDGTASNGALSCSAALPLTLSNDLIPSLTTVTIGTVNQFNPVLKQVYIRPIHAWAPHYEEDLSFQACAPQASPTHDPPLHFSKDLTTGNVAWCAEDYPSQNDNVPALDVLYNQSAPASSSNTYIGHVAPFTSHIVKNSLSADCTATVPSSIPSVTVAGNVYPAKSGGNPSPYPNSACVNPNSTPSGVAYHPADALVDTKNTYSLLPPYTQTPINVCSNQTCDRTAIATGGPGWTQFPLRARATHVEQAIAADSTYGCVMTYDGGGPKTGKATPSGGCCGPNVLLQTGLAIPGAQNAPALQNTTAHLEPDMPCLIPAY
jgi:hypothetical protein